MSPSDRSPSARKRLRIDDPDSQEYEDGAIVKRDEELQFEDGTVVVVAGNVEFCIYKGLLADCSPVFKDMFTFPQPPTPSAEPSEHLRVHLPDSPEDVRFRKPSFHAPSTCIRLEHKKYQIDIVDKAMTFIPKAYPKDFPSYLERAMLRQEHTIGVMNLAQFVGAADILPVADLGGWALFGTDLVRGFVRPNRTRQLLYPFDLAICIETKGGRMRAAFAG